jgi:predicted MPP superfamily phosphohydrolase
MNRTLSFIIFISIALSIYGLMNYYFLRKHKSVVSGRSLRTILIRLILATLVITPIAAIFFSRKGMPIAAAVTGFTGYAWLAFLFLFLATHGAVDVVLFIAERFGFTPSAQTPKWTFGISVGLNVLILVYGAFEARSIRTEQVTIVTDKLPKGSDPIRIVQLTDVHFSSLTSVNAARRIVDLVTRAEPDLIVCTGDFLDHGIRNEAAVAEIMSQLTAPLGKFAITGNHEFISGIEDSTKFIEASGFTLLRSNHVTVGDSLTLVGVDDLSASRFGHTPTQTENEVLAKAKGDGFTILLKHQPRVFPADFPLFDLQLSGHTHAGQIFPFSLIVRLAFKYCSGLYELDQETKLYVSRGTGTWGPPFRFLAPPEITVIELRGK